MVSLIPWTKLSYKVASNCATSKRQTEFYNLIEFELNLQQGAVAYFSLHLAWYQAPPPFPHTHSHTHTHTLTLFGSFCYVFVTKFCQLLLNVKAKVKVKSKSTSFWVSSRGLVVKAEDWQPRGCGFESCHWWIDHCNMRLIWINHVKLTLLHMIMTFFLLPSR